MALKRNETYPGRFSNPTDDHPQGAFKNRSAPGAQDGSYLEQNWANDWDGFFGRLLTLAGVTPNGEVDTASSSQYYDALKSLFLQRTIPFGDIKSDGTVKTALENLGLGEGSALPVGVPVPYPLATPPTGWMKCNGSSFNKTLLPALAAVYPSGVLPDLRGEFIRGWDDGRGVDSGRAIMSDQGDAIRNISGTVRIVSNSYNQNTARQMTGVFGWSESSAGDTTNFVLTAASNTSGYKNGGFTFDASSKVPTAPENRPRNIAFNYIVRTA